MNTQKIVCINRVKKICFRSPRLIPANIIYKLAEHRTTQNRERERDRDDGGRDQHTTKNSLHFCLHPNSDTTKPTMNRSAADIFQQIEISTATKAAKKIHRGGVIVHTVE